MANGNGVNIRVPYRMLRLGQQPLDIPGGNPMKGAPQIGGQTQFIKTVKSANPKPPRMHTKMPTTVSTKPTNSMGAPPRPQYKPTKIAKPIPKTPIAKAPKYGQFPRGLVT
jgi:hypothetical protein